MTRPLVALLLLLLAAQDALGALGVMGAAAQGLDLGVGWGAMWAAKCAAEAVAAIALLRGARGATPLAATVLVAAVVLHAGAVWRNPLSLSRLRMLAALSSLVALGVSSRRRVVPASERPAA